MKGEDSNLDIMPPRKKKNTGPNKMSDKLNLKKTTLSKSQKRKLKKIEEEKERELLSAKTAELLDKYKISEDVSLLLQSSKAIGRSDTKLEKRRRPMQLSKAGVLSDEPVKENDDSDSFMDDEPTTPENHLPTLQTDSEQLTHANEVMISAEEVHEEDETKVREEDETMFKNLQTTRRDDDDEEEGLQRMDESEDVTLKGPAFVVHVSRPAEVEETRKELPIIMMEQEIMEAINYHPTVIISGKTGCGKTTQVPQFLYEAGFGSKQVSSRSGVIGITQPRRVAVLATAKRVAHELGVRLGQEVGFQVRYDKKIGENSAIKFMTDGILVREIKDDLLLKRYSVIILDEAHERSLNTDILIGMLTRSIKMRQELYRDQQKHLQNGGTIASKDVIWPLKLILMSATLRVEDFVSGQRLFPKPPPVIEVPTRQYPVTIHFSKRTDEFNYMGEAYKKVMSIHKKLPQGGILVFVTGQREVENLCEKLRKSSKELVAQAARRDASEKEKKLEDDADGSFGGVDMKEIAEAFDDASNTQDYKFNSFGEDPYETGNGEHDDFDEENMYESDEESDWETIDDDGGLASSLEEDGKKVDALRAAFKALADKKGSESTETTTTSTEAEEEEEKKPFTPGKLRVLPLYAMLSPDAQLRVFAEVEEGERLVVVATNVAETSLTIPGIKYVVDTGRAKAKSYDIKTGMDAYEVDWISQASASQRAGRAGRTGPGHCYRLYSSTVFSNTFEESSPPEITRVPIDGVVLQLKSMNIPKVENFPFPTPPEPSSIKQSERCLKALEALDSDGRLTQLGNAMSNYPMSPRHSRMLLTVIQMLKEATNYSRANLVLAYAVAAAAALSLENPLIMQFGEEKQNEDHEDDKQRKKDRKDKIKAARDRFSNPSSDALTVAYVLHSYEVAEDGPGLFCETNGLNMKTMNEMSKLKADLLRLVFRSSETENLYKWTHGTIQDVEESWRNAASSKTPLLQKEEELLGEAICAGWADRVARKTKSTQYQACAVQEEPVYLHRWSSLINSAPELLVYSELLRTNKPYMHGATRVKPEWLVKHAKSLCVFSTPLKDPKPYYSRELDRVFCWVVPSFGPHLWELPAHSEAISDDMYRAAVFGYALLRGEVLPCLKSARALMAGKPETLLEREGWGLERVGSLLKALNEKKIDSLGSLRKRWEQNPNVLYPEIEAWFQKKCRHHVKELWQRMLQEAKVNVPGKLKRSSVIPIERSDEKLKRPRAKVCFE
ncbi:ATP-dependent RNA helicase DEAH13 isoform X1 [Brassica rapa]|uniref:ATP-dependent RNA helicase DEAH13 isoform X1 n=2 Tax=Brassica campestris TaxID=3711 RepID=UPI00142E3843|nr:ATP-dependent RNA helicase DEAH13 isoform X1 [Brassica rapa]